MRVHVHLAYGFDARTWERKWQSGELLGINDSSPYGYRRAEKYGTTLRFSTDQDESPAKRLLRQGVRVLLGFDLIHAWRNRSGLKDCDVVWTHTESNYLGVAATLLLSSFGRGRRDRPKIIGQSVWLFDKWDQLDLARKTLYRFLVSQIDVLTVHSPDNLAVARHIFPRHRVELVRFGIPADEVRPVHVRPESDKLRVLGVGNDRHRDWNTLLDAVADLQDVELRLVSKSIAKSALTRSRNSILVSPNRNSELIALYEWADVVVVPLKENLHASGITVCEEAAVMGVPVVASEAGGLRSYFDDSSIFFVPPSDISALSKAIVELKCDSARRRSIAESAQRLMGHQGLSSESFVRTHLQISESLLRVD